MDTMHAYTYNYVYYSCGPRVYTIVVGCAAGLRCLHLEISHHSSPPTDRPFVCRWTLACLLSCRALSADTVTTWHENTPTRPSLIADCTRYSGAVVQIGFCHNITTLSRPSPSSSSLFALRVMVIYRGAGLNSKHNSIRPLPWWVVFLFCIPFFRHCSETDQHDLSKVDCSPTNATSQSRTQLLYCLIQTVRNSCDFANKNLPITIFKKRPISL